MSAPLDCPKCIGRLEEVVIQCRTCSDVPSLKGVGASYKLSLDRCFTCGGLWFNKGELDRYLADGLTVIDSPSLGRAMDAEFDRKDGPCPKCAVPLRKEPSPVASSVTLDACPQCGGIWLDSTEIDRLEQVSRRSGQSLWESILQAIKRPKR